MFDNLNSLPLAEHPLEPSQHLPLPESQQLSREESDLQAKREVVTLSIRREGRANQIFKRRKQNITAVLPVVEESVDLTSFEEKFRQFKQKNYDISQLQELSQCLNSGDLEKTHYGIIGIRKLLSSEEQPPIQTIVDANLVPKIIEFAKQSEYAELQAEATWCLTNIVSGTPLQTQSVIDKGGIQLFVDLLKSSNEHVVEQAVWAVGNIAGDRTLYRDTLIKYKVLDVLGKLVLTSRNLKIVGQSCWAIANIIRTDPIPKFQTIKQAIPVLAEMIKREEVNDASVIADTLWAISWVIQDNHNRLSFLLQTKVAPKLIELLGCGVYEIVLPALKVLGNICYGNQQQIETLLSGGILHQLQALLDNKKKLMKREICWALSNIAASNRKHVGFLFKHQSLIEKLYAIFISDEHNDIKAEVGYMFVNVAQEGDPSFLANFYHQHNFMRIFLNYVRGADPIMSVVGLNGVNMCLKVGEQTKEQNGGKSILMEDLKNNQGIDILEAAQLHKVTKIYQVSAKILHTYFEIEDPLLS